ncbi:hypothetical protein EXS71_00435 [Candidatus Uhrbacteria bacterium]|nr:hypothetical protein [Candidatus Uhrbacteria bacterium]
MMVKINELRPAELNFLREARRAAALHGEDVFIFGRKNLRLITITRDPADLQRLVDRWQQVGQGRVPENGAHPLNEKHPHAKAVLAETLVQVYLELGQVEEAIRMAQTIPLSDIECVEAWTHVSRYLHAPEFLIKARRAAFNLMRSAQVIAWLSIFEVSRDAADLDRACQSVDHFEARHFSNTTLSALRLKLLGTYASSGMLEEARAILPRLTDYDNRCEGAALIAQASKTVTDLTAMWRIVLSLGQRDLPVTESSAQQILVACLACNQTGQAYQFADVLKGELKSFAFAFIAAHASEAEREEAFAKMEQMSVVRVESEDWQRSRTLLEQARACIAVGKLSAAKTITLSIPSSESRCEACLLVYQAEEACRNR